MEYPKIVTAFERNPVTRKFIEPLVWKNPSFEAVDNWLATEKIDGMNIRIIVGEGKVEVRGRTNRATLHPDLVNHCTTLMERFAAEFPVPMVFYGEGFGEGIQTGGAFGKKQFRLFDAVRFVGEGKYYWLSQVELSEISDHFCIPMVPCLGFHTIKEMVEMVRHGLPSKLAQINAEGLVAKTLYPLFDSFGSRLIIKIKTKDFEGGEDAKGNRKECVTLDFPEVRQGLEEGGGINPYTFPYPGGDYGKGNRGRN